MYVWAHTKGDSHTHNMYTQKRKEHGVAEVYM